MININIALPMPLFSMRQTGKPICICLLELHVSSSAGVQSFGARAAGGRAQGEVHAGRAQGQARAHRLRVVRPCIAGTARAPARCSALGGHYAVSMP